MHKTFISAFLAAALCGAAATGAAAQNLNVGIGFGIGFLPMYILDEQDLIERHAQEAGLDLTVSYQRISGSSAMQDAIMSGSVAMGAYGLPALLIAWDRARGTPQEVVGIAGVNSSPLTLVTNRAGVSSLAEFSASDRIAMPALVSPQMYVLQMAAEQEFGEGNHDRLRQQVVALPHPEALNSVVSGSTEITAYFSSPPFTQIALREERTHAVLDSEEVFGGKSSFLVLGGRQAFLEENPQIAEIVVRALDEATALIRDDPEAAAEIYLKVEPSNTMTREDVAELLRDAPEDFGAEVHGVKAYADFMGLHGGLRNVPESWEDVFGPALHGRDGS